ncbi:MAG: sulfatase [Deltaproteobacteria bacterium]|nr:sulfatase [Deltaproteobacteria bacterium]
MSLRLRAVALAVLVATPLACQRTPPQARQPYNVLFVSLDTVRQDVLGTYGHRPRFAPDASTSPALDRLAREGVRMADAYSSSSWTLPSHLSMFTGMAPLAHGVESESGVLDPAIATMAEILADHGYRTAGIYSAPFLDPHWGFGRGFATYTAVYGGEANAAAEHVAALRRASEEAAAAADWTRYDDAKRRQAEAERALNDRSQTVVTSAEVAAAAVAELDALAREGRPWFLFAHFFDAHCDYVPPPPWNRRFDPDYGGTFDGKNCMGGPAVGTPDPNEPGALLRTIGERDLQHAYALYEGEVGWVDDHLGTILRALDRTGMAATTLVVVVSDHGEEFFEHAGLGHRRTLYEEVVRIPMVLRLPGVLPAGATVDGPVSLTDLLPTVLEILGLPPAPTVDGAASFLAALRKGRVDRPLLLRTVMMFGGEVRVDAGAPVALRQVVVQDGFRQGPIKILRRRSWPQFQAGLATDVAAILGREAAAQYARETVRWIDLARAPDEPLAGYSADFDEPAARAALAAFRREYDTVLARRAAEHRTSTLPRNVRSRLESLGYIERGGGPAFPEPDLVLPPPGGSAPADVTDTR